MYTQQTQASDSLMHMAAQLTEKFGHRIQFDIFNNSVRTSASVQQLNKSFCGAPPLSMHAFLIQGVTNDERTPDGYYYLSEEGKRRLGAELPSNIFSQPMQQAAPSFSQVFSPKTQDMHNLQITRDELDFLRDKVEEMFKQGYFVSLHIDYQQGCIRSTKKTSLDQLKSIMNQPEAASEIFEERSDGYCYVKHDWMELTIQDQRAHQDESDSESVDSETSATSYDSLKLSSGALKRIGAFSEPPAPQYNPIVAKAQAIAAYFSARYFNGFVEFGVEPDGKIRTPQESNLPALLELGKAINHEAAYADLLMQRGPYCYLTEHAIAFIELEMPQAPQQRPQA